MNNNYEQARKTLSEEWNKPKAKNIHQKPSLPFTPGYNSWTEDIRKPRDYDKINAAQFIINEIKGA